METPSPALPPSNDANHPKLHRLLDLTEELYRAQHRLAPQQDHHQSKELKNISNILSEAHSLTQELRKVSFHVIFQKLRTHINASHMPSAQTIRFVAQGEDMTADQAIVEKLSDILNPLVQYSIQNHFEPATNRKLFGKLAEGTISLNVNLFTEEPQKTESYILCSLADDGLGQCNPTPFLNEIHQALTDLGCTFEILNRIEMGTEFKICIPRAPTPMRGLVASLFSDSKCKGIIPLTQIDQIIHLKEPVIENSIEWNGEIIPIQHLENIIKPSWTPPAENLKAAPSFAILVGSKDQRTAFVVDQITEHQTFLMQKTPGFNKPGILGRAQLDDTGELALVLDLRKRDPQFFA